MRSREDTTKASLEGTKPPIPCGSVRVAMVHVVGMAVAVRHRFVSVWVRMGNQRQLFRRVLVLVMVIVLVLVRVLEGLVCVLMFVYVGRHKQGTPGHASQRKKRDPVNGFTQNDPREHRGEPRRECEQGARLQDSHLAQPADE